MTPKQVEKAFEKRISSSALAIRFQDTADAQGSNLQTNPSDFVCVGVKGTFFAEVKSFRDAKRFPFSNIKKSQLTWAALIRQRKQPYFFYIYHLITERWFVIPADIILHMIREGVKSITLQQLSHFIWE